MQIVNSFEVDASADAVYAFLLDVNRVVQCMPGAQLSKVVDPQTFEGQIKIKVGPISVSYNGIARITDRDDARRTATLQGEGREIAGSGSARASALMAVSERPGGAGVTFTSDINVAGRVAQFGRGIMEDVSRRLVGEMARCIKAQLEGSATGLTDAAEGTQSGSSLDAVGLLGDVVKDRFKKRFGGGQ